MSSTNSIPVVFGEAQVVTPGNTVNLQNIANAALGGQSLANFMKSQIPYSQFLNNIGNSLISVIESTLGYTNKSGTWVDTGIPVYYAQAGTGSNALVYITFGTVVKSVWDQMQHPSSLQNLSLDTELQITSFKSYKFGTLANIVKDSPLVLATDTGDAPSSSAYDGYNIIGSVESKFEYSQTPVWTATLPAMVATTVVSIPFSMVAFPQFIKPVLSACWKGTKDMFRTFPSAFDPLGMTSVLDGAVTETTEEVLVEEVTVSVTAAGAACFGVLLVLIAIPIVVSKIAHYSFNTIQVYNLSNKYDIVWANPHIYNGTMNQAPVIDQNSQTYEQLIVGYRNSSPSPFVKPQPVYGSANFSFASNSAFEGLGEAFGLNFYTINPQAVTATDYSDATPVGYGAFAINIPFSSDNGLSGEFSTTPVSSDSYWSSHQQQDKTQVVVSNSALGIQMTLTIDYLSGEHTTPSGTDDYYYQSVIVFEDSNS